MESSPDIYALALAKANELEAELKRLNRWDNQLMPAERFENMGAFGSKTMSFEQWLQFVLIPVIHGIIENKEPFPDDSMLAPYAIRTFDGDPEAGHIHDILYGIDEIINSKKKEVEISGVPPALNSDSVVLGSDAIPDVLYTLAKLLPEFRGADLESQLQTFDSFLEFLSPKVRPAISGLMRSASNESKDEATSSRLLIAAQSVADGGRAAEPYNHEEAMRKYREEHKKNFPDL